MASRASSPLIKQISTIQHLKKAWKLLNTSNKKSTGLSKISIKDFETNLNKNIQALSNSLIKRTFTFSKVKGVALAKKNKGHRPLLISEVNDRIVHKALALKVEAKVARTYRIRNKCSFAYQKKRSIQDAILKMASYYQQGYTHVLEADIQSFFPTVNKSMLLKDLYSKLPDDSINHLLQGSLNQELGNREELKKRDLKIYDDIFVSAEEGIPQGNALSPLLANVFLSEFDQRMIRENIKMIRYADDFIIMCKSKKDAEAAYLIAVDELESKLGLKLYPLKSSAAPGEKISRILKPAETQFSFLSVKFDGKNCTVSDKKIISVINKLKDLSSLKSLKENYPDQTLGLLQVLVKVRNAVEGWIAAYSFLDIEHQILELDKQVNIALFEIFNEFGFALSRAKSDKIRTQRRVKTDPVTGVILARNSSVKSGLNAKQRKSTGIPSCMETYTKSKGSVTFAYKIEDDLPKKRIKKPKLMITEEAPF
jgi:Retron-type reverse transcriptase